MSGSTPGFRRTRRRMWARAALVALSIALSACALRQARAQDFGIPPCRGDAEKNLLSSEALQCWFTAVHGRWRTLNHHSHLQALVVEVEARDLRDASEISRRVVEDPAVVAFSEILVYVAQPQHPETRIRRVRWTRSTGFETLDYSSPAGDTPLTVRSSSTSNSAIETHPKPE